MILPFSLLDISVQTPESKAFLAALTARSTSLLLPAEQEAIFFPVAGSSTSKDLPELGSTHFPAIYSFFSLLKKSPTLSLTL